MTDEQFKQIMAILERIAAVIEVKQGKPETVTVCVKSGLGIRPPDRGAFLVGGCSLSRDTA